MLDDSFIGRQLNNFVIESLIGRGGMAAVYRGRDVKLNRVVAVKIFDARFRDNSAYAKRFIREAQAVSSWRHENIVQVYYADEEDGLYYFVMEYIDGEDLGKTMARLSQAETLMPHSEVLKIGRGIADALDYAHRHDVIHRDVKPANVLISKTGRVVLTDFGLALVMTEGSLGEVFGTPHYIAPEQARSSADAVPQSDLYSLGVILYHLLTGAVPFDDPSPTSVALQHITQPPPPPREINPNLTPAVESVLLKALSKAPADRYRTGAALIEALETALQSGAAPGKTTALTAEDIAARRDDLSGIQLEEYYLEELLGKGGMAAVYRGVDTRLNRRVAIKVIDAPYRADAEHIHRFEREAQAIARLEHPHIVRLYRYGEVHSILYMAMQYIDGETLLQRLEHCEARRESLPLADILRFTRHICQALDYAHRQGIIHRDVKPSNIMLAQDGEAYLTDFGLALLTNLGTRGEILGSPHYLSPEQAISSASVTPQSDLYSLGVILYRCFTGRLPFEAEDPMEVVLLQVDQPPPPPRQINPNIPPALEAVVLKVLAKEPEQRYPTGQALVDALESALEGITSETLPLPKPAASLRPAPSSPSPSPPPLATPGPPAASPSSTGEPRSLVSRLSKELASPAAAPKRLPPVHQPSRQPLWLAAGLLVLGLIGLVLFLSQRFWEREQPAVPVAGNVTLPTQPSASRNPTPSATRPGQPTATRSGVVALSATVSSTSSLSSPSPSAPTPSLVPSPSPSAPLSSSTAITTPYRLLFTKWDGSKHSVWVVNLDGSGQKRLSDFAASPVWTPDGERIVFVGETGIDTLPRTPPNGSEGIWRMTPDGLYFRQLLQDGQARSLSVAPTDGLIAFDSKRGANYVIYFIDNQGIESRVQIPGETPAWSPDGEWLVAKACRPACGLWLARRDGSQPVQLTFDGSDSLPAWAPDNGRIAFSRSTGDGADIFTIRSDGSDLSQLTTAPGHDTLPVWTPDSRQIVFRSTRNGAWQIFVMRSDGSEQRLLLPDNLGSSDEWAFDRMSID